MNRLTTERIRLGVHAATREDAIRAAGQVLVEQGCIAPGYIESMLGRELQASTYLGTGIAIPHGLPADRALIQRTGVSLVQLAAPVEWGEDQPVRLVVGIAARSDEHLSVLAALTDVLEDAALAERLAETGDAAEIVAAFTRRRSTPSATLRPGGDGGHHVDVKIAGAHGLHARPATRLIDVARAFDAEIRIQHGGHTANGKALASILKLGVPGGATIRILATGPDAAAALAALKGAVEHGLDEEASPEPARPAVGWQPVADVKSITGVPASPGLAIGALFQLEATHIVVHDHPAGDAGVETRRLHGAVAVAHAQLGEIHASVEARGGRGEAAIFRAHQALLEDEDVLAEVTALIEQGHGAAWAWDHAIRERIADVQKLQDARLAGRAADLRDVGQRVLRALVGTTHGEPRFPDAPVILVADDLTPSEAARLDPKRTLGLCTASGGPTSHTAIIARSLDIPAVVGAGPAVLEVADGTACILDGATGRLYLDPGADNVASARALQSDLMLTRDVEHEARFEPALMTDGRRVEVVANIGQAAEAAQAVEAGAEGVGLLRTEFLFLNRAAAPTEDEQFEAYSTMTAALHGLPLIIRTLDIGGDKVLPYLTLPPEDNPFLGVRGIRLCLRRPDLFLPQLRAIYRAARTGPVRIMFPMIATPEDLRQARAVAEQVRAELDAPHVDIGIMIEVPSAVVMAAELAREVDFFSIGTNDLTQYLLAIDRLHPTLGGQVDGLHPAVLRMIDQTVRAADGAGKWVGVCGGVAGEPLGALILTGLGVTELSMSLPSVAAVKAVLRRHSFADAEAFAQRALRCATAAEVRALVLPS